MKVAYVIPSLQNPSGWRTLSIAMVSHMSRYVTPVIFASLEDLTEARALFPDCTVFPLPVTQQAAFASRRRLPQLAACRLAIARGNYPQVDLIHSLEAYPTGLVGSWLSRKLNRPHVLTANGTYGVLWDAYPVDRRAYRQVLRSSNLVCPISYGTAEQMELHFGNALDQTHLRVILLGNNFIHSVPAEQALQHVFPVIPTMISVGDVKPRKGQDTSLAAFALLKKRLPEARYQIIGRYQSQAPYFQQLQAFIQDHALQDVTFLGAVSNGELRRAYQQSSLFVLTPRQDGLHFEGFGLVYLEAGAYGLPVIGTRTGGVPDVVQDGVTGILCAPDDVVGLAEMMFRLLTDFTLAYQMGRANRQRAELLTWERCAAEQFQAYQQVVE